MKNMFCLITIVCKKRRWVGRSFTVSLDVVVTEVQDETSGQELYHWVRDEAIRLAHEEQGLTTDSSRWATLYYYSVPERSHHADLSQTRPGPEGSDLSADPGSDGQL